MSRWGIASLKWLRIAGNGRLFVLCSLLFVVSTMGSFWINFPAELIQQRLLQQVAQETGLSLRGQNATMLLPVGMAFDLVVAPDIPGINALEFNNLQITPNWLGLLSATLAVNLNAAFAGGEVTIDATRDGLFNVEFDDISVEQLQRSLPYQLSGLLTGRLSEVRMGTKLPESGEFSLKVDGSRFLGLERIGLPATLSLGNVIVTGSFGENRVNVDKVEITGGVLRVSGGGNIIMGKSLKQTRLNLNIRLHPTASTPDSLHDLLKLSGIRPTVDGSYLLRFGGSLLRPAIR